MALTALLAIAACDAPTQLTQAGDNATTIEVMVAQLGFSTVGMVEMGDQIRVEGDVILSRRLLLSGAYAKGSSVANGAPVADTTSRGIAPGAPNRQWAIGTFVSPARISNLRVNLADVIAEDADWATAVREAMAEWNAIPGTDIMFVESTTADITVTVEQLAYGVAAQASWPSGNPAQPGPTLKINWMFSYYSPAQKKYLIMHELGHTLGFMHSNKLGYSCNGSWYAESGGVKLANTPDYDAGSIMNGCSGGVLSGFSQYDRVAAMIYGSYTMTQTNNGGYPQIAVTAPRGAEWMRVLWERNTKELTDGYYYVEQFYPRELVDYMTLGQPFTDTTRSWGYTTCGDFANNWPMTEERHYYLVEVKFPQSDTPRIIGQPGHTIDYTPNGWTCWNES